MLKLPSETAATIAAGLVPTLGAQGAEAIALVGSHATGAAGADSDLDLAVVGEGPHYRLEIVGGVLVSLGWAPEEEQRRRLYEPRWLGTHVPGWRTAVPIWDPSGVAASIQQEASAWTWEMVEKACDHWVAEHVTGLAEEALKLQSSLRTGAMVTAAVQRSLLALGLARAVAVHRRLLYGSENRLWQAVADELGPAWTLAQSAALGLDGEGWEESGRAALDLFRFAAEEIRPLLDERQRAVVDHVAMLGPQTRSRPT